MIIISCLIIVFVILPMIAGFFLTLLRILCVFRKTCAWKNCPFRHKNLLGELDWDSCRKCPYPYDEKEKQDIINELNTLKSMLSEYEENYRRR